MSQELRATIDALSLNFPFGIPKSRIQNVTVVSAESIVPSHKKLLRVALERGLGVSFDQVSVVSAQEFVERSCPLDVILAFGEKAHEATAALPRVLQCGPLQLVMTDANEKKKFWASLKEFKVRLERA